MKPWLKRALIGVFGASVLFGGLSACGSRSHHGPGWDARSSEDAAKMQARAVDWVTRELSLDEAQKARLVVLADRLREQRATLMGGSADPRAQMNALVAGPTFDRAQAQALVEAKTQTVARMSPALIGALADFYDSLRPEQQAKVREVMAERGRRHGWRG